MIANTTAIKGVYQRIRNEYDRLMKNETHLQLLIDAGMTKMDFMESNRNILDLITEYQDKQDIVIDFDDTDDDEEDEEDEDEDDYDEEDDDDDDSW